MYTMFKSPVTVLKETCCLEYVLPDKLPPPYHPQNSNDIWASDRNLHLL